MFKLMKIADIEKKVREKTTYKTKTFQDGDRLLAVVNNPEVESSILLMKQRWNDLCGILKSQRRRFVPFAF